MKSVCTYIPHALVPHKREQVEFCEQSLSLLAPEWRRPYIALVDGKAVLRKDWDITIYDGHSVVFIDVAAIPQDTGGGSNPLRIIATLAVVVLSYYTAGLVGGGLLGGLAGGAVAIAGSMLVNVLIPLPGISVSSPKALESPSPTYSLQAQGNYARLEQAIPEHFGRHIAYPDFAAQPYTESHGNEVFLYQLMCITRGTGVMESINIEDTPIDNFEEVDYEIIPPYGTVSLFPAAVEVSEEVAGQDLPTDEYIGPYTAVSEGKQANHIGVDFAAPRGMYHVEDDGSLERVTVSAQVEARLIDDDGAPLGDWVVIATPSYGMKTTTPQRFSEKISVTAGRYEVRIKRTDTEQTGSKWGHDLVWSGLRSYLPDVANYGDCTLLAVRMQASSQLSSTSSRKVNVVATRKLPAWNGSAWTEPQPTRSIAWAAAYCCKQEGIPDERIDLAKLLYLDGVWAANGDTCDGRFDSFVSFWDALTKICSAGRCKPFIQAGIVRFHHDAVQSLPAAMFSMQNIVAGSFKINYLMPTEDTADAVQVTYFDASVWRQRRVLAQLDGSTALKPAKMDVSFVTSRERALAQGLYNAACNQRRRKIITFQAEMDGFIPSYGDLLTIQHDMPAWGQGGECLAVDQLDSKLLVHTSEPLSWTDGAPHYVAFRDADGSQIGPLVAAENPADPWSMYVFGLNFNQLYIGSHKERTHYFFGPGETWGQKALTIAVKPKGMHFVEITAVNDDPYVYTADQGVTTPPVTTSQLPQYTSAPRVAGLIVRSRPDDVDTMLMSWQPTPWAERYLIEASAADGEYAGVWTRLGETGASNFTAKAIYGASTVVRVAAVGTSRGPWVSAIYGGMADYMWIGDDSELMWSGLDTDLMWS